ncbi:MAG: tripartite tricarboxylate transporter substrate binding protein [Acetobacteraceae bacterium]|nr:tripartite tricarboxylate transporter substrate binding protein [Acetobacteraceae bacterium]
MRRRLLLAGLALPAVGRAQPGFPARSVEIIVPYAAGGPTDRYARAFAAPLAERWGQSVVAVNRPGGAAAIGAAAAANAAPDGHTLLLASMGMITNQILLRNLPYDPRALAPLCRVALGGGILFVHPSIPATTPAELRDWGRANPGSLRFGSAGIGSTPHLSAELFAWKAGIEIVHIPYRGVAPAMTDLIAGHINALFDQPASMRLAREGKVRALAASTPHRLPIAPEVPTLEESGFDATARTFYGFFARSAVPEPLRARIAADLQSVARSEPIRALFAEDSLEALADGPEEFERFMAAQLALWTEVIRERRITM